MLKVLVLLSYNPVRESIPRQKNAQIKLEKFWGKGKEQQTF